jgi:hypothetical protein
MISDVQSVTASSRSDVLAALRTAASKTGLDFDYLLHTAMRESSLDVQAKSKTSSASGLFQFVEQTWLGLVKQYGERYGLSSYANSIQQGADRRYSVASAETKSAILALRQNPELSALMAGEGAKQTKQSLECALGRQVCGGELYAAHFFGPSGARHLIELKERNPDGRADLAFPQAAKANKAAFYHADGTAKTVGEVYAWAVDAPMPKIPVSPSNAAPQRPAAVAANSASINVRDLMDSFTTPERVEITAPAPVTAVDNSVSSYRSHGISVATAPPAPEPRILSRSPVVLSPGIVEILASLSPVTIRRAA